MPMVVSAAPFDPIHRLKSRLFVSDIIGFLADLQRSAGGAGTGQALNPIMSVRDKPMLG
jgi:hypothetical protein